MDDSTNATSHLPHPALIMIRGLPGSGKSHLAHALRRVIGMDDVLILDPDAIDKQAPEYHALCRSLEQDGVEAKFFPNRYLKQQGYGAIDSRKIIIWNQAFTDLYGFQRSAGSLQEYAHAHGVDLPLLVVELQIDASTAKKRVTRRAQAGGHAVDDARFERFTQEYKSFAEEGFATITIDGKGDTETSVATVLQALAAHNMAV